MKLERWVQQRLVKAAILNANSNRDFQAWGQDIRDKQQWEKRILNCLNLITDNQFSSLTQASLFACTHHRVKKAIQEYKLKS